MTPDDAMAWWYGRIDFERRAPQAGDLKLGQMRALLHALGQPQNQLRIIHIAGSKGKGSTAAMLARVLRAAGYRTGLFTSPHLCRVEERIQVDGEPIARDELIALLGEIRRAITPDINATFFEVATAAGWLHFLRRRVEFAIVEVGLGGRYDSTNVCDPLLSIITSISHDHTQVLGDTLSQIAFEKAGILKPARPAISAALAEEARLVIERVAAERGCPLIQVGRDVAFDYQPGFVDQSPPRVAVRTEHGRWPALELGLLGAHQAANAATVIAAVEELQRLGFAITPAHVAEGLARVRWPARLELLGRQPYVVLDCAHNVSSVQALVDTLRESFPPARRLLIFAVSSDKDARGMLKILAPEFERVLLTRYMHSQRAVEPRQLAEWMSAFSDRPTEIHESAADAWRAARAQAQPADQIVIAGSVFLAGELRPLIVTNNA